MSTSGVSSETTAWLQQALASLLSRTKVYIRTDGCTVTATTGSPILIGLQLEQE